MEQVTIWPGEIFTPLLLSASAMKVIREVESQFCSSSSFSLPRRVPGGKVENLIHLLKGIRHGS